MELYLLLQMEAMEELPVPEQWTLDLFPFPIQDSFLLDDWDEPYIPHWIRWDGNTTTPADNDHASKIAKSDSLVATEPKIEPAEEKTSDSQLDPNLARLFNSIRRELFPRKLWMLAMSPDFPAISWTNNGRHLQINLEKLKPYLGFIGRSASMPSFIRLLHLYRFRKTKNFNRLRNRKLTEENRHLDRNLLCYQCDGFDLNHSFDQAIDNCIRNKAKYMADGPRWKRRR